MAAKVPIRTVYTNSVATGLAEFQSGEFVDYTSGGTGLAALGSAGQVLKVNSGASALEYGTVEAVINIDGMTDGSSATIAATDKIAFSDGGTEKYLVASQIDTYVSATSATLTNKTLTTPQITSGVLNTGVSGSAIADEDNMSSDSATKLATQQSIKAYVDATVTAEDLDVTSDSGTIDIDLDSETLTIAGGTGLDSSASSTTVTLAIDSTVATLTGTQTLTNKTLTSPTITGTGAIASGAITSSGVVTGTGFTIGSAVINEAELETIDGITAGTVIASKALVADANIDITGGRHITISRVMTGGTVEATTDTAAGDNAAMGYTSAEGLILTGQGSTNDITIKNDADATVISIPTGTTGVTLAGTTTLNGVAYTWPGSDAAGSLRSDGSGALTWTAVSAGVGLGMVIALGG